VTAEHPGIDFQALPQASLGLVVVESNAGRAWDLRALRDVVAPSIHAAATEDPVYLVFRGDSPALEDLENARVIADLC
jgi:hypothetical protein